MATYVHIHELLYQVKCCQKTGTFDVTQKHRKIYRWCIIMAIDFSMFKGMTENLHFSVKGEDQIGILQKFYWHTTTCKLMLSCTQENLDFQDNKAKRCVVTSLMWYHYLAQTKSGPRRNEVSIFLSSVSCGSIMSHGPLVKR